MGYGVFHDCLVPLLWATPVSRAGAQTFMIKYLGENAGPQKISFVMVIKVRLFISLEM
jgi:hypothetical protein